MAADVSNGQIVSFTFLNCFAGGGVKNQCFYSFDCVSDETNRPRGNQFQTKTASNVQYTGKINAPELLAFDAM